MKDRSPPPPADRDKLRELFQKLDVNHDGRLELGEIRDALHLQGITAPGEAEVSSLYPRLSGLLCLLIIYWDMFLLSHVVRTLMSVYGNNVLCFRTKFQQIVLIFWL